MTEHKSYKDFLLKKKFSSPSEGTKWEHPRKGRDSVFLTSSPDKSCDQALLGKVELYEIYKCQWETFSPITLCLFSEYF